MRSSPLFLINGTTLDLVPARVNRARSVAVQRLLATSDWLLRRKSDGRFLACGAYRHGNLRWHWFVRSGVSAFRVEADALARQTRSSTRNGTHARLQRKRAADAFDQKVGADYAQRTGLARVDEPHLLAFAGLDRYRRPLWLAPPVALAWSRMHAAAARDDVTLEAISGFRSRAYQVGIFDRKKARGLSLDEILAVNAAPGFSEHHSGRAIDVGTTDEPPAEESFENTAAFRWLASHASRFGFVMSYPRDNPHGIAYEPWHWMWQPAA